MKIIQQTMKVEEAASNCCFDGHAGSQQVAQI